MTAHKTRHVSKPTVEAPSLPSPFVFGPQGWQSSLAWCHVMLEGSLQMREAWRASVESAFRQQLAWLEELREDCLELSWALLGEPDADRRLELWRQHLERGLSRTAARQTALLELLTEPMQTWERSVERAEPKASRRAA